MMWNLFIHTINIFGGESKFMWTSFIKKHVISDYRVSIKDLLDEVKLKWSWVP